MDGVWFDKLTRGDGAPGLIMALGSRPRTPGWRGGCCIPGGVVRHGSAGDFEPAHHERGGRLERKRPVRNRPLRERGRASARKTGDWIPAEDAGMTDWLSEGVVRHGPSEELRPGSPRTGGALVRDAEGVHAVVDGLAGLVEGFFEVGLVVVVAVVVGGVAIRVLGAAVADVLDAAVDEGEHVAGGFVAPHGPVALTGGDVDG